MVVGVCQLQLMLQDVFSLKQKRSIVKRLTRRVREKFPVSIAEVGDNDVWQRSCIGFAVVGNDRAFVNEAIDKIIDAIECMYLADIVDQQIEIISFNF
jgi:uncharacterized protein YlxP (DUF503 family)